MSDEQPWDLTECMARLRAFREARDWAQFHRPKDLAAAIAIEAGELQEPFLWKSDDEIEAMLADAGAREHVRSELADVVIFALYLADRLGLDLAKTVMDKVELNEARYEKGAHRGQAKKAGW